jgi:hypothetical protein
MLVAVVSDDVDEDENIPEVVAADKSGPGGAGKTKMLGSWCLPDRSRATDVAAAAAAVSGRTVPTAPCKPWEALVDTDAVALVLVAGAGRNGDENEAVDVDGRKPNVGVEWLGSIDGKDLKLFAVAPRPCSGVDISNSMGAIAVGSVVSSAMVKPNSTHEAADAAADALTSTTGSGSNTGSSSMATGTDKAANVVGENMPSELLVNPMGTCTCGGNLAKEVTGATATAVGIEVGVTRPVAATDIGRTDAVAVAGVAAPELITSAAAASAAAFAAGAPGPNMNGAMRSSNCDKNST